MRSHYIFRPRLTTLSVSLPSLSFTGTSRQHNTRPDKALFTPVSAEDLTFTLTNVPPDGDCFFHCISKATYNSFSQTAAIRLQVTRFIYDNWEDWKQTAEDSHNIGSVTTKHAYWTYMATTKEYATRCEIEAACHLFQCAITVWLTVTINGTLKYIPIPHTPHGQPASHLHLLLKRNHYQLMSMGESNKNVPTKITPFINKESSMTSMSTSNVTVTKKRRFTRTESSLESMCTEKDIPYVQPTANESVAQTKNRRRNMKRKLDSVEAITEPCALSSSTDNSPTSKANCSKNSQNLNSRQPLSNDIKSVLQVVQKFEQQQMSYSFNMCSTCQEKKIDLKLHRGECLRCRRDKNSIKMFSEDNHMDPGPVPEALSDLSIVEQQLISKISPAIHLHMLKHGGLAAKGHCITFPQAIDEPAHVLPKLPEDVHIIKVRRKGRNDTSKDFRVRRYAVQNALMWLKENNPAFQDILISDQRLSQLPLDGELQNGHVMEYDESGISRPNDQGPAADQLHPDEEFPTDSTVLLPDPIVDVRMEINEAVQDVVNEAQHQQVKEKRPAVIIPWPTRDDRPLSEHTTAYFFTMAFPTLFPLSTADFRINRPLTCPSMSSWAQHLIWYHDGRFAQHPYFKFIVHNMVSRKRALDQSKFIVHQKLGDQHMTVEDLKALLQTNDDSISKKIMYFSNTLRGSPQYWSQRSRELSALLQYNIMQEKGLPSFFCTGSCAEYYFKPLRRLLQQYTNKSLATRSEVYQAIQQNSHVVTQYFDLRTQCYFSTVMRELFSITSYWYRYEFAPSRGMIHWHGLTWRSDRQPHELLYQAVVDNTTDDDMARDLARWAQDIFGLTATHPAGSDDFGQPRKDLWPPPEGSAPPIPEEQNPLLKLLGDVADTQENLANDHLMLTNKINLHSCSDFCWRKNRAGKKVCRMEFGTEEKPGKEVRDAPAIVKDKNGSFRLEMTRDHPRMVQHSRIHTQAWRANGDISLILSKSNPAFPDVSDILPVEKYVTGYACKGNQGTGVLADIFKDIASAADTTSTSVQSLCSKLLMQSVKRDVSGVEACHELAELPLYRSSHQFQYVSMTGSRVLERTGTTATKSTPLDKYLSRAKDDTSSWYTFLCKSGKVPVIHGNTYAEFPISEQYARTMLLLHWPNWRHISDIVDDGHSWLTTFQDFLETNICPNFVKASVEKAKAKSQPLHDDDNDDQQLHEDSSDDQPEWLDLLQPNILYDDFTTDFAYSDGGSQFDWSGIRPYPTHAQEYFQQLCQNSQDTGDLLLPDVNVMSMNNDQQFAYNIIMNAVIDHSEGKDVSLRLIVAGVAGSGKSYLIKCLVHSIRKYHHNNKAVQVLAPTGNSANLISGKTIHNFLKVPCGPKSRKDMSFPTGPKAEQLQENCEGLVCLLIDERSLVGCNLLGWMEFHCQCGLKSKKSWGGLPVVVFLGDDIQLPPVCDSPVYNCKSTKPVDMRGSLLWQEFQYAVTLNQIVRQNSEEQDFKHVLHRLRTYSASPEDTQWLQRFQWDALKLRYSRQHMEDMAQNALYVFPTHAEEWEHNKCCLLQANKDNPIAKIDSVCHGIHSKSSSADAAGGLVRTLYVCTTARVQLTSNINIDFGLFNGSVGTIMDIVYQQGQSPKDALPQYILVDFPKFTGPPFLEDHPTWIPVPPVDRRLECMCCKRTQVPLRPGFGTTIHRVQGMTIGPGNLNRYIVINPGSKSFESRNPGVLYVSLSRATTAGNYSQLPDFAFHPQVLLNHDRISHEPNTPLTRARKKEVSRIAAATAHTKKTFAHLIGKVPFMDIITKINSHAEE